MLGMQRSKKNEALLKAPVSTDDWHEYSVAGLQFSSPFELNPFKLPTVAVNTNLETYMGQFIPPTVTILLQRRHLTPSDGTTLKNYTSQVLEIMKQKFPDTFQSTIQDGMTDGNSSVQISAHWQKQGMEVKDSVLLIFKRPYIWHIQVLIPGQIPNADDVAKKLFDSIKILPQTE